MTPQEAIEQLGQAIILEGKVGTERIYLKGTFVGYTMTDDGDHLAQVEHPIHGTLEMSLEDLPLVAIGKH